MNDTNIYNEINSRIYLQAQHLSTSLVTCGLNAKEEDKIFQITLDVTLKLQAMIYHLENYTRLDSEYQNEAMKHFCKFPNSRSNCCLLIHELEAYLFQFKSSLDVAIKVLGVLLPNYFKTNTFGNKGNRFIKNLNAFKKNKQDRIELIDKIILFIKDAQERWLNKIIDLRDTVSHHKSLGFFAYSVSENDGKIIVAKPTVLDLDPLIFMKECFRTCMEFIQDLISFSIILYLPPVFILAKPEVPTAWIESGSGQYIKYSLSLDPDKMSL